jgi:O-antigen/teichoic acid export membrane protein
MFLGHDLAWWSFVLTIVGLILMFPAAIVANILTPKLQNWWAQRSLSSLKKRIDTIDKQLNDCEGKYAQSPN